MKRNFSATTETTLRLLGKDFDLHNDFAFDGLHFVPTARQVKITFKGRASEGLSLIIAFEPVSVFCVSGLDTNMPSDEDKCLDCFGYLHPDDLSVMDGFLPERSSVEDYHMIFLFRGGLAVKVYAEKARAETRQSGVAAP